MFADLAVFGTKNSLQIFMKVSTGGVYNFLMDKIFIVGLAGSGKTFLANRLREKYGYPTYTTDWILYYECENHRKIKLAEEEYLKKIREILNQDKWIVEGVHYFEKVASEADLILFIDTPIHKNIFGIMKRYLTDGNYRRIYRFKSSLSLIRKTIIAYYTKPREDLYIYPKYKNREKYKRLLEKYKDKVTIVRSVNRYLKNSYNYFKV